MGFCSCTVKFVLIVFNLVCALAGLAILTIGVLANTGGGSFKNALSGQVTTASICFMVLGGVVFLIAFFGCCGALREDTCMIQTYAVILLVILILEIAIGVTAFVFKSHVEDDLRYNFDKFFANYDRNKKEIDDIQISLKCCGYDGPEYWRHIVPPRSIPNSCCKAQSNCNEHTSYQDGCYSASKLYLKKIFNVIGAVAIAIAVVELIGVVCAFYVSSSIKRADQRGYV